MNANTVEVDYDALKAEAERAIHSAIPDDTVQQPGEPAPGDPLAAQSWRPLIEGIVPTVRMTVFAQWKIEPHFQTEFITSLSASLDLLFPGGLDGKYAPLARLVACCAGVVFVNYAANGNKLPPLGLKKADDKKAGEQQRAAA